MSLIQSVFIIPDNVINNSVNFGENKFVTLIIYKKEARECEKRVYCCDAAH